MVAAAGGILGVLVSFQLLKTDQAVAISAAAAAIVGAWMPSEDEK